MRWSISSKLDAKIACCVVVAIAVVPLSDSVHRLDAGTLATNRGGAGANGKFPLNCDVDSFLVAQCVGKAAGDPCVTCQVTEISQVKGADAAHPAAYAKTTEAGVPPQTCGVKWVATCKQQGAAVNCVQTPNSPLPDSCANEVAIIKQQVVGP